MKQEAHGPQRSPEITAPRGLIGRIYVGDHYTLLHTEYISYGPHGLREYLKLNTHKSLGANDPRGVARLGPRGLIGRIYVGTSKHCYILNM